MIKKSGKGQKQKQPGKKSGNKKVAKKGSRKREPNPVKVQKDLALMVESKARKLVQAVIKRGMSGQVAPVKFALEVANIHPHSADANQATKEEDCLAKTLLDRLGIPSSPVVADLYEAEEKVVGSVEQKIEDPLPAKTEVEASQTSAAIADVEVGCK